MNVWPINAFATPTRGWGNKLLETEKPLGLIFWRDKEGAGPGLYPRSAKALDDWPKGGFISRLSKLISF